MNKFRKQILLPQIGNEGQKKISNSKIVIVGLGGLAAPLIRYLSSSGVSYFAIIDDDIIEESNLPRQNNFTEKDIDKAKIEVIASTIKELNPKAKINSYYKKANKDLLSKIIVDYDIVIDASDNFATKFMCNDLAHNYKKTFISGSFSEYKGYISVYKSGVDKNMPCFRCFHPDDIDQNIQKACFKQGVFSAGVGVIGTLMAAEAIKEISGVKDSLSGKIIFCDFLTNNHRTISLAKSNNCFCHN
jgi:molybdopterin/thiamine biosynthesis adenylyltransferase